MSESKHDQTVQEISRHLWKINEEQKDYEWVMVEGLWMPERNSSELHTLCDIIAGGYDGRGLVVEVKSYEASRRRAIQQLLAGEEFLRGLGYDQIKRKIAYYSRDFHYEEV